MILILILILLCYRELLWVVVSIVPWPTKWPRDHCFSDRFSYKIWKNMKVWKSPPRSNTMNCIMYNRHGITIIILLQCIVSYYIWNNILMNRFSSNWDGHFPSTFWSRLSPSPWHYVWVPWLPVPMKEEYLWAREIDRCK